MINMAKKWERSEAVVAQRINASQIGGLLSKKVHVLDSEVALLEEEGYEGGFAPVYDVDEAAAAPEILENGYIVEYDHPVFGHTKLPGFPVQFEKTPLKIQREAPEHGQHTEEILHDILGFDWEKISEMREEIT